MDDRALVLILLFPQPHSQHDLNGQEEFGSRDRVRFDLIPWNIRCSRMPKVRRKGLERLLAS